jgi:hypothetical protein
MNALNDGTPRFAEIGTALDLAVLLLFENVKVHANPPIFSFEKQIKNFNFNRIYFCIKSVIFL